MCYSSFRLDAGILFFYTLFSVYVQSQEWPVGTLATASSTHPSIEKESFLPGNAIDNDATTKWNDNTEDGVSKSAYPDIFTLSIGSVVRLDGIMLLSGGNADWIQDYTVETSLNGVTWNLSATVQRNSAILRFIRFDNGPLNVKLLRVIITAARKEYSRISELLPVYAVSNSSTNSHGASTITNSSPSKAPTWTTQLMPNPRPVSSKTKSDMLEIVASVLGGLAGILLGLLAYLLWLLKKQSVGDTQKLPLRGFSFDTPVVSELEHQHTEPLPTYTRSELA